MAQGLSYDSLLKLLESLEGLNAVLIGGQAVAFWAELYAERIPELRAIHLLASKDVDFCCGKQEVIACAARLGVAAHLPEPFDTSPNSGVVRLRDVDGVERVIDFLHTPFGVDPVEVGNTAIRAALLDSDGQPSGATVRVMHPVVLMEARACNVVALPGGDTPHGRAQLQASVICTREFLLDLLEQRSVRRVLSAYERIFRFVTRHFHGRRTFDLTGIDPFAAVQGDERLPPAFLERRYPQMQSQLAAKRAKRGR